MTKKTGEDCLSQASSLLDPFTVVRGLTLGKLAERVCLAWQISRTNCFCVFLWLMVFAYSLSITCHVLVCLWDGVVCKTRAERERERDSRETPERERESTCARGTRKSKVRCMQPPFSATLAQALAWGCQSAQWRLHPEPLWVAEGNQELAWRPKYARGWSRWMHRNVFKWF